MEEIKLDYKVMGQGSSIVVFESGLGGNYHDWHLVTDAIESEATLITYNRAGYGDSISLYSSRTTGQIAKELNSILEEIGVKKKIILVGHSFGGLCVQHFARLYPDKVKGVILIDSTSENFNKLYTLSLPVLFSHIAIEKLVDNWNNLSKKSIDELYDLMNPVLSVEQQKLTKEVREEIEKFSTNPLTYKSMADEIKNWRLSSEQIKAANDFPNIPLYVIARDCEVSIKFYTDRGIPEEEAMAYEDMWRKLQVEHSRLSEKGKFIIAVGSDHNIQLEKPKVVIDCIRELIQL